MRLLILGASGQCGTWLTRRYLGSLLLLVTAACGKGDDGSRPDVEGPPPAARDSTAGIPLATLVGDCAVDSAARHEDPLALVEEYVRRDAEGPFEREDLARAWPRSALTCMERARSNHHEVIRGFSVEPGPRSRDSAVVYVRRERLFTVNRDAAGRAIGLTRAASTWIDTVVVVRTTLGWRIHDIAGGAHQLPGRARGALGELAPEARALLDSLASRTGS